MIINSKEGMDIVSIKHAAKSVPFFNSKIKI